MTQERSRLGGASRGLGVAVLLIQLFDIAVHAATEQVEPVRVASNLILMAWVILVMTGRTREKLVLAAGGSIGAYLALNGLFLLRAGVTNPDQGGDLRVMLFLLVGLTLVLSTSLTYLTMRKHRA